MSAVINHDPVELLKSLISIPSVNPMGREVEGEIYYETKVTEWLVKLFQDRNIPYRVDEVEPGRANVVAAFESPGATRTVMLDAHQDTVPVEGMTIPPFEPVEKEGRLYGRGSCDVKGGMAAMLSTFLRLYEERPENACNVLLSCTCDEEATLGGIQHLAAQWQPEKQTNEKQPSKGDLLHAKPDLAIVAEPTELDVIVAHKGVIRWKIITRGRACHSSAPEEGENAIYRMGQVLQLVQNYAEELRQNGIQHPRLGSATLSVGLISGGISVNVVADYCEIEVDRRLLPGEEGLVVLQHLMDHLNESLDFEVEASEPWVNIQALPDDENQHLAEELLTLIEKSVGPHESVSVPFGTHASPLAAVGVPAVVFGPGSIEQAHTKDEWIDVLQLRQATEIYYRFCTTGIE